MRINSLIDSQELAKDLIVLPPGESHHLARVLRVQFGQQVVLFDGFGGVADAVVESVSKTAVTVQVVERRTVPKPLVEIDLIQAVPKSDRWELVLQKAVELGATGIRPMLTQHTEFKPHPQKQERWQRTIVSAAQQCEVRWLPVLHPLQKMEAILPLFRDYDLVLIGSLFEGTKPLREVALSGCRKVALLIGPEGDFTLAEVSAAMAAGAVPVSFGDRILRTETAALFGLSVLSCALL